MRIPWAGRCHFFFFSPFQLWCFCFWSNVAFEEIYPNPSMKQQSYTINKTEFLVSVLWRKGNAIGNRGLLMSLPLVGKKIDRLENFKSVTWIPRQRYFLWSIPIGFSRWYPTESWCGTAVRWESLTHEQSPKSPTELYRPQGGWVQNPLFIAAGQKS